MPSPPAPPAPDSDEPAARVETTPAAQQPAAEMLASCSSGSEPAGCQLARQEPAPTGVECSSELDCASRHCRAGSCVPASCSDGILNQGEVAADCAGPCAARCGEGATCGSSADCASALTCLASSRQCLPPGCADGEQNGDETGRDCGGSCGGCPAGSGCGRAEDCATGICNGGACAAPGCADQVRNQDESDIDCGGSCGPCGAGQACTLDGDCQAGTCQDGACCGGKDADCTRCARRLASSSLNCASNGVSEQVSAACNGFLQCLTDHAELCPRRQAPGCSDPGGVCDTAQYGGTSSAGLSLADGILGTAACNF
ncbi:MAG: hypothetical protein RL033_2072 [Pseudomonadota bacterium]|jgi:hypothetical protein